LFLVVVAVILLAVGDTLARAIGAAILAVWVAIVAVTFIRKRA
jgi:hypothetical protein